MKPIKIVSRSIIHEILYYTVSTNQGQWKLSLDEAILKIPIQDLSTFQRHFKWQRQAIDIQNSVTQSRIQKFQLQSLAEEVLPFLEAQSNQKKRQIEDSIKGGMLQKKHKQMKVAYQRTQELFYNMQQHFKLLERFGFRIFQLKCQAHKQGLKIEVLSYNEKTRLDISTPEMAIRAIIMKLFNSRIQMAKKDRILTDYECQ